MSWGSGFGSSFGGGGSGFGSSTGSSGFGFGDSSANNSTGFGGASSGGFGSSAFGAPAAASTGFGGSSGSGGFGSFGGASNVGFSSAPASGGFGTGGGEQSSFSFGSGAGAAPGGFGASTSSTGFGGLGAPSTGGFGSSSSGSLFGSQPGASTGFGGFGGSTSTAPASTGFGGGFGSSLSSTAQTGFGGGGSAGFGSFGGGVANAPKGTTSLRFNRVEEKSTDTNGKAVTVYFQTITAMKEYADKSLEELRWEDYEAGHSMPPPGFGAQQGIFAASGAPGASGFGANNTASSSLFGQPSSSSLSTGFGSAPGGFGSTPSAGFGGSTGGSLFGSTSNNTSSGFGFGGSSTAPAAGGFAFGSNTQSQPAATNSFSFGATNDASKTSFGSASSGFSFGTGSTGAAAPSSGGFGGFGSTPGAASTAPSAGFSFGSTSSPSTGGSGFSFGSNNNNSSSTGGTGGFSFGTSNNTGSSLFGSNNSSTGSGFNFGSSNTGSTSTGFGSSSGGGSGFSFGNTGGNTGGSLFGSNNAPSGGGSGFSFGSGFGSNTNTQSSTGGGSGWSFGGGFGDQSKGSLFGGNTGNNQAAQQQQQQQAPAKVDDNPFLANFLTSSASTLHKHAVGLSQNQAILGLVAQPSSASSSGSASASKLAKPAPTSIISITPRSSARVKSRKFVPTPSLAFTPSATRSSPTGIVQSFASTPTLHNSALTADLLVSRRNLRKFPVQLPPVVPIPPDSDEPEADQSQSFLPSSGTPLSSAKDHNVNNQSSSFMRADDFSLKTPVATEKQPDSLYPDLHSSPFPEYDAAAERIKSVERQSTRDSHLNSSHHGSAGAGSASKSGSANAFAPILTRPEYYTSPPMSKLRSMSDRELRAVKNFTVGHRTLGEVRFEGETDVRNLHLDALIMFERGENGSASVEVYPNGMAIPEFGVELNKPAIITLNGCYPVGFDKDRQLAEQTGDEQRLLAKLERYEKKLRETTEAAGGQFIKYDTATGQWTFRVKAFSG